jgi:hypothetical protein
MITVSYYLVISSFNIQFFHFSLCVDVAYMFDQIHFILYNIFLYYNILYIHYFIFHLRRIDCSKVCNHKTVQTQQIYFQLFPCKIVRTEICSFLFFSIPSLNTHNIKHYIFLLVSCLHSYVCICFWYSYIANVWKQARPYMWGNSFRRFL